MSRRRLLLAWVVFICGALGLSAVAGGLALFAPPESDGARLWAVVMVGAALAGCCGCVAAAAHLVGREYRSLVVPVPAGAGGATGVKWRTRCRGPQGVRKPVGSPSVVARAEGRHA